MFFILQVHRGRAEIADYKMKQPYNAYAASAVVEAAIAKDVVCRAPWLWGAVVQQPRDKKINI